MMLAQKSLSVPNLAAVPIICCGWSHINDRTRTSQLLKKGIKEPGKGTWEILSRTRDSIKAAMEMSSKTETGKVRGCITEIQASDRHSDPLHWKRLIFCEIGNRYTGKSKKIKNITSKMIINDFQFSNVCVTPVAISPQDLEHRDVWHDAFKC